MLGHFKRGNYLCSCGYHLMQGREELLCLTLQKPEPQVNLWQVLLGRQAHLEVAWHGMSHLLLLRIFCLVRRLQQSNRGQALECAFAIMMS